MATSLSPTPAEFDLLNAAGCFTRQEYVDRVLRLEAGDAIFVSLRLLNYADLWVSATFDSVDDCGIRVQIQQPPDEEDVISEMVVPLNQIKKTDVRPRGLKEYAGGLTGSYFVTLTVCVGFAAQPDSRIGKLMLERNHLHPDFKEAMFSVLANQLETVIETGSLTDCIESINLSLYD